MGESGASNVSGKLTRLQRRRGNLSGIQPPSRQWSCRLRQRKHQRCSKLRRSLLDFSVFLLPVGRAGFLVRLTLGKFEGDFLYDDVRGRPPPFSTPFSLLVAEIPFGMACRVLPAKRAQRVQRSGDTAAATAEACCHRTSEPPGATVRRSCTVHVLSFVVLFVGVGFLLFSGCGS